ncbi:MAG: hypothetical protein AAGH89_03035 [Verrucomicrobiota bacterium]
MRMLFAKIVFHFIQCRETMELFSLKLDKPLNWRQRLAIRMHCLCCPGCSKYGEQLPWLRTAARKLEENFNYENLASFTPEEKAKLKEVLAKQEPES